MPLAKPQTEGGNRQMNWLDVVLVIFLIITAVWGLMRGLLSTLIPLIGLIVGIVIAGRYYDAFAHRIFSSDSTAAYVAAFVILLLAFLIAAAILAAALHKLLSLILLDWVDHLLGTIIGLATGGLIAGAVLDLLLKHSIGVSTI